GPVGDGSRSTSAGVTRGTATSTEPGPVSMSGPMAAPAGRRATGFDVAAETAVVADALVLAELHRPDVVLVAQDAVGFESDTIPRLRHASEGWSCWSRRTGLPWHEPTTAEPSRWSTGCRCSTWS